MDIYAPRRRALSADAHIGAWHAPDGWPLRRMDWPAQGAARGSLLFAGGRGDFIEKYAETLHDWHASGWNVASFDWRGQGQSRGDISGGNVERFEPWIDDLDALIADWRSATPGPHVVIAHSMGGHLLLRTLVDRRPDIDGAVLVAPMIMPNSAPIPPGIAPWVTGLMCRLGRTGIPVWKPRPGGVPVGSGRQRFLTASPERYADELWWWEQEPGFNLGAPSWGWMRAAYRSAAATFAPQKLARVMLPVLILAAEQDRLVNLAAIRRVAGQIPGATLELYPDAAHEILRDADPVRDRALARIDAFLSGLER